MHELPAFAHSSACHAPRQFAWDFWTDVANWAIDTDVESIELDGPFAAGARGVTHSKSSGRIAWRLARVDSWGATIECPLPGATVLFCWQFNESGGETRITQHVSLSGAETDRYLEPFRALEFNLPAGMEKLCRAIEAGLATESSAR